MKPVFSIHLHSKDLPLLHKIHKFFGGIGFIHVTKGGQSASFNVTKLDDLIKHIIPHFKAYPLRSAKKIDFQLWLKCVELIENKEHLTEEGLNKILSLKSALNRGLSENLKAAFANVVPTERPAYTIDETLLDPYWLAGLVDAEGCFVVKISKNKTHISGLQVSLRFQVTQHNRDRQLLESLASYLDCGSYYSRGTDLGDYVVSRFTDIVEKIIPFFDKYPLEGAKSLNYADFKKVAGMMKGGAHLTLEGLEEIRKIKAGMNSGRPS